MADILSSFRIKNLSLHNRLILPPLAIEKAGLNGEVTPAVIEHYREMSRGGYLSMVIVEHCYITPQGKAGKKQLSIASDDTVDGLSQIVDTIHGNGSMAIAQISHAGGAADRVNTGMETVSPSIVNTRNGEADRALEHHELPEITALFAKTAGRAGIQLRTLLELRQSWNRRALTSWTSPAALPTFMRRTNSSERTKRI